MTRNTTSRLAVIGGGPAGLMAAEAACAAGFRITRVDHPVVRQEAGADVPGLLFAIERIRDDD